MIERRARLSLIARDLEEKIGILSEIHTVILLTTAATDLNRVW